MLWLKMGWRNLRRHLGRSLVQIATVALSLLLAGFMVNLAEGSYVKMIDEGVRIGSGHLAWYQREYLTERKTAMVFDPAAPQARLAGDPRVSGVFPRLHLPSLARSAHDNRGVLLLGIDFPAEIGHSPLLEARRLTGGRIPLGQPGLVLMGDRLAQDLRLAVGRKFVVMFPDREGEIVSKAFRVGGTFKTGVSQIDRGTILVDRETLAEAFKSPGLVHELAVRLRDRGSLEAMLAEYAVVSGADPASRLFPWQEAMPEINDAIRMDRAQGRFIILILYLIVGIGTANTLLMGIMERTREFGLMRALGLSSVHIRVMVAMEAFVAGSIGIALGMVLTWLLTWHYGVAGIDFTALIGDSTEIAGILFEPVINPVWTGPRMLILTIGMLTLVMLASLYPARQALKIKPAEAMRTF